MSYDFTDMQIKDIVSATQHNLQYNTGVAMEDNEHNTGGTVQYGQ